MDGWIVCLRLDAWICVSLDFCGKSDVWMD